PEVHRRRVKYIFHFAAAFRAFLHHRIRKFLNLLKAMIAFCAQVLVERQARHPSNQMSYSDSILGRMRAERQYGVNLK
ncbi:MAG TPA: hypothetical protein VJN64_17015, partial [Terriglobales bacterium]|nr:hypothetical protein [Terriglobales bacterium]